jgi:4'-phosphopantetheinyl transferase
MSCAASLNSKTSSAARQHLKPLSSPESDVQIWIAHLDSISPKEIEHFVESLDTSERSHAERFRSKQDRHRYIAAHGFLRLALGEILGRPANALVLEESAQGKPELRQGEHDQRRLKFNLSHAAGWTLIAIGWRRELGIDLESVEALPADESLGKLAARVLSKRELEIWNAISNPVKKRETFLRTWTRKESYVKATGEGLRHDLANIELPADGASFDVSSAKRPADRWIVHDLSVPVELTAALAVEAC